MKIAFLNMYNGLVDRGAETFVKEVAQKLAIRHEVVVFQSGGPSGKENYKVEKIPMKIDWARKSGAGSFLSLLFLCLCDSHATNRLKYCCAIFLLYSLLP